MTYLSAADLPLPSVTLTPAEEHDLAKRILTDQIVREMTASATRQDAFVQAGIAALGMAAGLAIGGLLYRLVIGSK